MLQLFQIVINLIFLLIVVRVKRLCFNFLYHGHQSARFSKCKSTLLLFCDENTSNSCIFSSHQRIQKSLQHRMSLRPFYSNVFALLSRLGQYEDAHNCQALFYVGSKSNFVTFSFASRLNFGKMLKNISVIGIANVS